MSTQPLWQPSPERIAAANLTRLTRYVRETYGVAADDYAALWQWSVDRREDFWPAVWDFCGVIGDRGESVLIDGDRMPGAKWFSNARLNFAENLLRRRDDGPALVFWNESGRQSALSFAELYEQTARLAATFRRWGIRPGDRVAALLPNLPHAIVAMLAAASVGATFSSCSPDFGVPGAVDRFGQIEPRVLIAADGYYYGGKTFATIEKAESICRQVPSVEHRVLVPYCEPNLQPMPGWTMWQDALAKNPAGSFGGSFGFSLQTRDAPPHKTYFPAENWDCGEGVSRLCSEKPNDPPDEPAGLLEPTPPLVFERLPFDHPLYILYSSGTTGRPKCIVHGAGGTLLQHLKEHVLHTDLRSGDRLFYFTTTGWMMWNWLATGLASGCTLVLFDGSPFHPNERILWDLAEAEGVTVFGTSAKYLAALEKAGAKPRETHRLNTVRTILSTGSPLLPESFDYVYRDVCLDACLSSISGGTDIVSCFVLGCPTRPVYRGEIQVRGLGMKVEVFDDAGRSVVGQKGELVCTAAFPSMPIGFWNDPDGEKYRQSYFARFPGVWRHGDYTELTPHGGAIIYGRSDAVLNPGGVRIGTAEIYRQVEQIPEVIESLAVGQQWQGDVRIVLFVRLRDGLALNDSLRRRIVQQIRTGTTPRHVPAKILQVSDLPRTRSGKLVELAVTDILHGRLVSNREALANPDSLAEIAAVSGRALAPGPAGETGLLEIGGSVVPPAVTNDNFTGGLTSDG